MYCLSISSLCISVNVLSTCQSDETHLNNFPKDFKLPTFFSPFQRKCANLLRRHWLLFWQNSRRIILQDIVVFQIKNDKKKNNKSCFPTKVLLWHQRWISFFFFFFYFVYFFLSSNLMTLTGQSVLVLISIFFFSKAVCFTVPP